MKEKPWIVLVGGFLGAGKTTLLLAAAGELERRGLRSALILNDQGDALVDTAWAERHGIRSGEVTGGCFCCRFSDLVEVIDRLRAHAPDVIFAEPVGSCTDISATTLHPLHGLSDSFRIAPYTVLIDPQRAGELLRADADAHLTFLFRKQIEEADLICVTKSDLEAKVPEFAHAEVRQISAKTGQGVAAWLDEVLCGRLSAGRRILDIDYEQYARAEAALAWLNAQVTVRLRIPASPAVVVGPLLERLDVDLTTAGIAIAHLKAIDSAETGFLKAAICGNGQAPVVEGMLAASPAREHELLLNLRAVGEAAEVRQIIESNLARMDAELSGLEIASFHPAPPTPERRVSSATQGVQTALTV